LQAQYESIVLMLACWECTPKEGCKLTEFYSKDYITLSPFAVDHIVITCDPNHHGLDHTVITCDLNHHGLDHTVITCDPNQHGLDHIVITCDPNHHGLDHTVITLNLLAVGLIVIAPLVVHVHVLTKVKH
jgi:hypothetical protein